MFFKLQRPLEAKWYQIGCVHSELRQEPYCQIWCLYVTLLPRYELKSKMAPSPANFNWPQRANKVEIEKSVSIRLCGFVWRYSVPISVRIRQNVRPVKTLKGFWQNQRWRSNSYDDVKTCVRSWKGTFHSSSTHENLVLNLHTSREISKNAILRHLVAEWHQMWCAYCGRSPEASDQIWSSQVKACPKY